MGSSARSYAAAILFVMLFISTGLPSEMGGGARKMVAEGRMCDSPSHKFKGPCMRDSNCKTVCEGEGFHDGDCQGFRRRCFCRKPC
ncbi:unnamed protein product [Cuscuta campestris]|uniref:Knottins-like domain-containing protein n=1 Tax=Cuscuta campestris TaxID=132261 RepID=A0A484LC08_9ASTE|nr:unnamed protein product [Cuscuta campestris]